uniref:Beta-glucosidase n=1 Tax=Salix viminalis TaxID=40686 RepID=A0A6N2LB50_SALVM
MGMDAFIRFSILWSRVLPHGRLSAGVNEEGIKSYNDLIDDLLENDRVKKWITLNEPWMFSVQGYIYMTWAQWHRVAFLSL